MKRVMKTLTALVLAASVILGTGFVSEASENPYVDVNESDWYYNSVMYAREQGFMTGVNPTHFDPGANLQRQDFALALMRHYINNGRTVTQQDDGTYYGKAVAWARETGVMTGYSNGDFGVGDVITRQDCIVTLFRYMQYEWGLIIGDPFEHPDYAAKIEQFEATYADVGQLRDYSYEYMFLSVMNLNLITGIDRDGVKYLDPNGLTTRGTASVMMERWFEHYSDGFIQ